MTAWLTPAEVEADLDRVRARLHHQLVTRVDSLRHVLVPDGTATTAAVMAAVFADAASDEARRRALLRLVAAVNDAAAQTGTAIALAVTGAKRDGDRRRIGFVRPEIPVFARDALAELHGLTPMGTRRAVIVSDLPVVRVALLAAGADQTDARPRLWSELEGALQVVNSVTFTVRDLRAGVLAGDDPDAEIAEGLAWADLVVAAGSTALLSELKGGPRWLAAWDELRAVGRIVPVRFADLPDAADRTALPGSWLGAGAAGRTAIGGLPPAGRTTFVGRLVDELCAVALRLAQETVPWAEVAGEARGDTPDLDQVHRNRPELVRAARRDWTTNRGAGDYAAPRENSADLADSADITDVARFVVDWATGDDGSALLALLGDSGIGKTIAAQGLTRELWARGGGIRAHYFDLRTLTGIASWNRTGVPAVRDLLAACVAGGWTDGRRPIGGEDAATHVDELLEDSRHWPTVFVVDGLDEALVHLSASDAQRFTHQLLRLRPNAGDDPIVGPHTKLVLTCRTHYFTDVRQQIDHFKDQNRSTIGERRPGPGTSGGAPLARRDEYTSITLLALTREQIQRHLVEVLGLAAVEVTTLLDELHDLWDVASTPFLLAQLTEVLPDLRETHRRGSQISAAEVYRAMVRGWVDRDAGKHVVDPAHKPMVMAHLAHRLWRTASRSASIDDLGRWMLDALADAGVGYRYAQTPIDLMINDLHTATFLVRQDAAGGSTFRFAHSSMAEYFLAAWLVRCLDRDDRAGWELPTPSRETLVFLGQLLAGSADRERLLATLAGWLAPYRPPASELLFDYAVLAIERGLPAPSLAGIDLTGVDLRDRSLVGAPGRPLVLAGATLRGARLDRSRFEQVDLRDADLTGARLDRAMWNEVTTTGSRFDRASAEGALLRHSGPATALPGSARVIDPAVPRPVAPRDAVASLFAASGHTGGVWSVAVSAEGSRVVSGGGDGVVRVWDAGSGEVVAVLSGHNGGVLSVAVSAEGSRVVSRDSDDVVRVWDAGSGEVVAVLSGHNGGVLSVAVSPEGSRVVSGGEDGVVRVWDAGSGEVVAVLSGHIGAVLSVAVSPEGSRVVSGGEDGVVRVWDAGSGEVVAVLSGHIGAVLSVAVSPDGSRVVSGGVDGVVRVWDAGSGEVVAVLSGHTGAVRSVAVSPDGSRVVSGGDDGVVRVWDAGSGEVVAVLSGHTGRVWSVAVSAEGSRVVSRDSDGVVRVWDAGSGEVVAVLSGHTGAVRSVTVSPDGSRVVSGGVDGVVRVWDAGSGEVVAVLSGHTGAVRSVTVSPDGSRVVSGGGGVGDYGVVRVWDAGSGEVVAVLSGHTGAVRSVAVSADGSRVVSGGDDGVVRVWDAGSGALLAVLSGHIGAVWSVAVSPEGSRVVSGGVDGVVRVWDAGSGEVVAVLSGHIGAVLSVAVSPDGSRVVSGGVDGVVRVWDAGSGEVVAVLSGHTGAVWSVAVSPEGSRVVSGGDDGVVRVWDAGSGEVVAVLSGHTGAVWSVAVSPEGSRVVSGGDDGVVRVWDVVSGTCAQIMVAKGDGWATWRPDDGRDELLAANDEAWRWLRVQVRDADHRMIGVDPYEWHYPTHGLGKPALPTSTI